jgi:GT2 family glycosyltransferase
VIRVNGLSRSGVFDTRYFAYWEDQDLSVRMFRSGGDLRGVAGARVHHLSGASTGGAPSPMYQFLITRNRWLFYLANAHRRVLPRAFLQLWADGLARAGILHVQGHAAAAVAAVRGLAAATVGRWGEPPAYRPPGFLTGLLAAHPWRVARLLNRLAGWCPR